MTAHTVRRHGQTVREALDYLAVAERETQDLIAGLIRMQAHAGLAVTVGDALDVIRLVATVAARAQLVVDALVARIDTLDACAEEPAELTTRFALDRLTHHVPEFTRLDGQGWQQTACAKFVHASRVAPAGEAPTCPDCAAWCGATTTH